MNTFVDHADMVRKLRKPGTEILKELTPEQADLDHMAKGISGEAGEILDAIKKHTVYQKPLDIINIREELGDLEFFMEGLRQILGINRDEILAENVAKLSKRFHKGAYSNEQAQERADKK